MESTNNNNNNNNNQLFLCEFKELRNELSALKKRTVQLEKSHEKQQERIDILERENHALKTELNHLNGDKAVGSALPASISSCNKTKSNNNNDDYDEAVVLPQYDNGDCFDSLSDDLLHKIVKFDGNCYSKFGSINKRCKNIYDMEEYKLKKQTCVFGYGTLDMMLENYLQQRREGWFDELGIDKRMYIADAVIWYNRLDAIEWIIQLGDSELLKWVCYNAAEFGRINILTKVFVKLNLTMLEQILDDTGLCNLAAYHGQLESLKWLRKYGAKWDARTFDAARREGHDDIVQYLRVEGCPETFEERDESSVGSDEDFDY